LTLTTETTEMFACENGPDCLHAVCPTCPNLLRNNYELATDHPGTAQRRATGQCDRCRITRPFLSPEEYKDQSHILMTDAELEHVLNTDTRAFIWHMDRRNRIAANRMREATQ